MDVRELDSGVNANHAQPDQRRKRRTRYCCKHPRKGLAQHVQRSLTGRGPPRAAETAFQEDSGKNLAPDPRVELLGLVVHTGAKLR